MYKRQEKKKAVALEEVHEDDDFFVVNKPARLPTQAHESNGCECVPGCVERSLGLEPGTLRVTHRLDASTSGVVVLAKHRRAAAAFNDAAANKTSSAKTRVRSPPRASSPRPRWQKSALSFGADAVDRETREKTLCLSMTKTYVALTSGRESLFASKSITSGSEVTHWMYPGPFGPEALGGAGLKRSQARFLRAADADGEFLVVNGERRETRWKKCVLRVLSCDPADEATARRWHETHEAAVRAAHKAPPRRWLARTRRDAKPENRDAFLKEARGSLRVWQVRVELVTGRTHQVRAQLAKYVADVPQKDVVMPPKGSPPSKGELVF